MTVLAFVIWTVVCAGLYRAQKRTAARLDQVVKVLVDSRSEDLKALTPHHRALPDDMMSDDEIGVLIDHLNEVAPPQAYGIVMSKARRIPADRVKDVAKAVGGGYTSAVIDGWHKHDNNR